MNEPTRKILLLAALAQSVFLASMGTSMANLALPAIGTQFGVGFSSARLIVLAYLVATTVFSLVVGRCADLKGHRRTLMAGTALFIVGTAIAASAPFFWVLFLARAIQGVGASALVVLPVVIAAELVSSNKTGRSIGLLATMSAVGTASGPSLGGLILASCGWRSVFLTMTLLGAANFILLFLATRKTEVEVRKNAGGQNIFDVVRSVVYESALLRQLLYNVVVSAVMMTTLVVGPFYLSQGLQLSPMMMGLIMSAGPITSIISGVVSGFAVDRFGARLVVTVGFTQLLVGTISFVLLPAYFGALGFAASAVLLSLGYQLFLSANSTNILKSTAVHRRGLVSGALSLSRNLGLIFGTSAIGGVFDLFAKNADIAKQSPAVILSGLQAAFISAAILIGFSFTNYLINEQRSKNGKQFPVEIY